LGEPRQAGGVVVTHSSVRLSHPRSHDRATWATVGRALATLKGHNFAGEYDPSGRYPGPVYFVPGGTLLAAEARALGAHTEDDLFGGVVSHPLTATKVITHPRVSPDAYAPDGWSDGFARRVLDVVLPGFSAFTLGDARRAGALLLEQGPVRLKPARGVGWRGQVVAAGPDQFESALSDFDTEDLPLFGLVLEHNLTQVTTYSVGQVRVAGLVASYCGTQRATTDQHGAAVYGGSDLFVVRGNYDALLGYDLTPEARLAVAQARTYDEATQELPGMFASRRNYDVAWGLDPAGRWRCGVLEQSWRVGGASGPEVAALLAFHTAPELRAVRAWCVEAYSTEEAPPAHAVVHFCGIDEVVGPLTKYTLVEPHDGPRGGP
jgi:hypothetical protein